MLFSYGMAGLVADDRYLRTCCCLRVSEECLLFSMTNNMKEAHKQSAGLHLAGSSSGAQQTSLLYYCMSHRAVVGTPGSMSPNLIAHIGAIAQQCAIDPIAVR